MTKVTTNKPEGFKDDKEEEKANEAATEASTKAKTETENTTAKTEEATKAEDSKTTTARDDKKSGTTTTTAKTDDKNDAKKDDKKADKDSFTYYYFTSFVNVLTPDADKDQEYPAASVQKPEYFSFFGVSGDAFVKGNVLFEGFETLDDLNKAMEEKYPKSSCETNIKKK